MSSPASSTPAGDMPMFTPGATKYQVLGLPRDATSHQMKVAYRRLALLYHPDRHSEEDRAKAEEIFKLISSAYRTLSDERERRRYDTAIGRGEEFREAAADAEGVSLADVLADIDQYEHIFSEDKLEQFDATLRDIVVPRLIDELHEQIVAVYPMPAAPAGAQYTGTYKKGAVVLTSLRVLLPFTYTWQETDGNTRTTYTGMAMSGVVLPRVQRIVIASTNLVRNKLEVEIEHENGRTLFRPGQRHLGKLLLVARLWGIPVHATEHKSAKEELRWVLVSPLMWAGGLSAAVLALAAALGMIAGGFIDNPASVFAFCTRTGVWQSLIVLCGLVSATRLARYVKAYRSMDLTSALRNPPVAAGPSQTGLGVAQGA